MQKKNIYMWWLSALPSHFFPRDERSGTEWNGVGWPLQWAGGSPRNGSCTIWFTNDNRSSNSYCQQYLWFHSNPKWLSVAHQLQLEDMSCPPEAEIIISCTGTCGSPHLSWAAWRMKLTSVDSWFDGEWSQRKCVMKDIDIYIYIYVYYRYTNNYYIYIYIYIFYRYTCIYLYIYIYIYMISLANDYQLPRLYNYIDSNHHERHHLFIVCMWRTWCFHAWEMVVSNP